MQTETQKFLSTLISPANAARMAGRSRQAIHQSIDSGRLPSIEIDGVKFVYRMDVMRIYDIVTEIDDGAV